MATLAPTRTTIWQRLWAAVVAVVDAAETDAFTVHDARIAQLERRLGQLERAAAARTPEFAA